MKLGSLTSLLLLFLLTLPVEAVRITVSPGEIHTLSYRVRNYGVVNSSLTNVYATADGPSNIEFLQTSTIGPVAIAPEESFRFLIDFRVSTNSVSGIAEISVGDTMDGDSMIVGTGTAKCIVTLDIDADPPSATVSDDSRIPYDGFSGVSQHRPSLSIPPGQRRSLLRFSA